MSDDGMDKAASQWTKAWRIIVEALKEIGAPNVDQNSKAIIARLAAQNLLIVNVDDVKE